MALKRLYRYSVYFRRGHGVYLAFLVAMLNFVVIQYRLLVQYVKPLDVLFPTLAIFAVAFIPAYILLATLIGWWDTKRGTMKTESIVGIQVNPYFGDVAKALQLIAQGRSNEAVEILERWTRTP